MKPRPFYRWKSFWLGLCMLVFLAWAWRDSYRVSTHVAFAGDKHVGSSVLFEGILSFYFSPNGAGPDKGFHFNRDPTGGEALMVRELASTYGYASSELPNTLIFFPCLALWLAWLLSHWKREQKK